MTLIVSHFGNQLCLMVNDDSNIRGFEVPKVREVENKKEEKLSGLVGVRAGFSELVSENDKLIRNVGHWEWS